MQQFSVCRAGLDVFGSPSCSTPFQFFQSVVLPLSEFSTTTGSVPAFSKGVVVGGLRFRYAYSVNTGTWTHTTQIQDFATIHSALIVAPLDATSGPPQAPLVAAIRTGSLFINRTVPYTSAGVAGLADFRVLWRGLDMLRIQTNIGSNGGGEMISRMESTAEQQNPPVQRVKAKCRLPNNMGLFFLTEIAGGWTTQTGDTAPWNIALDLYGVAAVKPIQRGFGA